MNVSNEAYSVLSTFAWPKKSLTYHTPSNCPAVAKTALDELVYLGWLIKSDADPHIGAVTYRATDKGRGVAMENVERLMNGELPSVNLMGGAK
jgi:hypothetical protein